MLSDEIDESFGRNEDTMYNYYGRVLFDGKEMEG